MSDWLRILSTVALIRFSSFVSLTTVKIVVSHTLSEISSAVGFLAGLWYANNEIWSVLGKTLFCIAALVEDLYEPIAKYRTSLAINEEEMRNKFGITEKDPMEIYVDGSSIILKKYEPNCIFCGSSKKVTNFQDKVVCEKCISNICKLNIE